MAKMQNSEKSMDENMEELQNLIQEDSQLPSDIRLAENIKPGKNYSEIQTVLLIGVTGMLGPYILRDICARPQIKKIYCLMRKTKQEMTDRLRERLHVTGVIEKIDTSKIICISGDISYENLGMSTEEYSTLSEDIDAVVHLGIKADYTGEYSQEGDDSLRTVNVLGTVNILRFAVNKKLKSIYVASTLLCSLSIGSSNFSEDWQDPETFTEVTFNFGYRISRFISEQLLKQAIELGVPVKIFRFGGVGGESQTGKCDYDLNQYSLGLLTIFKLGYIPNLPIPVSILPIDTCSKLSLKLFFNSEAPADVYNVCKTQNPFWGNAVIDIGKEFGFKIKPVSVRKFAGKVKKHEKLPLRELQEFYFTQKENTLQNLLTSRIFKGLMKILKEQEVVFENYKTIKYIPELDDIDNTEVSLRRDVQFLMRSGAFEKYGIDYFL